MSSSDNKVPYNKVDNNGLLFGEKYIPKELLSDILCTYIDYKTLLSCQLVCKHWQQLIQSYIWRKKAEMTIERALPVDENILWTTYYLICDKPFHRNLIKNHSGEFKLEKNNHWKIAYNGGDCWSNECPPVSVPPLPNDPVFEGKKQCFVTSHEICWKHQVVDLIKEGFTEYILDNFQPTIKVSEWYSARSDCLAALYRCQVDLLGEKVRYIGRKKLDVYIYSKIIESGQHNQWFQYKYEFKNYGPGLRRIRFFHGGNNGGIAGTCVEVGVPECHQNYFDDNMSNLSNKKRMRFS